MRRCRRRMGPRQMSGGRSNRMKGYCKGDTCSFVCGRVGVWEFGRFWGRAGNEESRSRGVEEKRRLRGFIRRPCGNGCSRVAYGRLGVRVALPPVTLSARSPRDLKAKDGSSSLVSLAALTMKEREKLPSSRLHLTPCSPTCPARQRERRSPTAAQRRWSELRACVEESRKRSTRLSSPSV